MSAKREVALVDLTLYLPKGKVLRLTYSLPCSPAPPNGYILSTYPLPTESDLALVYAKASTRAVLPRSTQNDRPRVGLIPCLTGELSDFPSPCLPKGRKCANPTVACSKGHMFLFTNRHTTLVALHCACPKGHNCGCPSPYWAVQAGLLTPLTFARNCLSPFAAFTSGVYFLHN